MRSLLPTDPEPPHGSVLLSEGPTGTAWQRHHNDGRWHSTSGRSLTWDELLARVASRRGALPLLLVHDATEDAQPTHNYRVEIDIRSEYASHIVLKNVTDGLQQQYKHTHDKWITGYRILEV